MQFQLYILLSFTYADTPAVHPHLVLSRCRPPLWDSPGLYLASIPIALITGSKVLPPR